jgi:predicted dehydrogenase
MGKRRIRCLRALGIQNICGYDTRADRRAEVLSLWQDVQCIDSLDTTLAARRFDAWVISVPPAVHAEYMIRAARLGTPFFVEASVIDDGLSDVISAVAKANIVAAPSRTLCYHPAIKEIKRIVNGGELGKISNILYHSGQYLPDWHVYESVSDYYVSEPATGGCREILPFELTWFTDIFGFPKRVASNFRKTISIEGAESIDDTYNCLLDYDKHLAVITVDVVSRHATRRLLINGSDKQLHWNWDQPAVQVFDPRAKTWSSRDYSMAPAATGYNVNIGEGMYMEETGAFLDAVRGVAQYPSSLEMDHQVLRLLYRLEASDKSSTYLET